MRVASEADKARIDPSTGPIQGVQPKANAAPIKKGKNNYLYKIQFQIFYLGLKN